MSQEGLVVLRVLQEPQCTDGSSRFGAFQSGAMLVMGWVVCWLACVKFIQTQVCVGRGNLNQTATSIRLACR